MSSTSSELPRGAEWLAAAEAPAARAYDEQMQAVLELVHRLGTGLDFGFRRGALPGQVFWFAAVDHAGTPVRVDGLRGPVHALEALARRVLNGARCIDCGRPVDVPEGPGDFDELAQSLEHSRCRYRREGRRWLRGCEPTPRPRHPIRRQPHRPARKRRRR